MIPGIRYLKAAAVTLALSGLLCPQLRVLNAAESQNVHKNQIKVLPANSVLDIKLSSDGFLTGRVLNHSGSPSTGSKVVIMQAKSELGFAIADSQGNFSVPIQKAGMYEVSVGATVGTYRVWTEASAPPSAKPHCLLITGENGARGQYGLVNTIAEENLGLILLVSTTGLALAGLLIALHAEKVARAAENKSAKASRSP